MISENVRRILAELPEGVDLVAAAKERAPEEVLEAVDAGVRIIGENYIRDAQKAHRVVGKRARWHFIGIPSRQKHDLLRRKTLELFDMIETVDSIDIAAGIDRKCGDIGKVMPVLIEINSGREAQKSGVLPDDAEGLIREIAGLRHVRITGLMTMGPRFGDPEDSRPYFVHTRKLFERIRGLQIANVEMKHLSMGMTNSFPVALQEGATMVRIGTKIFGERAG
ncbi:MAG: YggS family pyridoxal phosphate-dependent enzyme [Anaerolineales bacterium]